MTSTGSGITNWAGNVHFAARAVHRPASVEQLQQILAGRTDGTRFKALGTGHSFSTIADTDGELITTGELPRTVELDAANRTVRVGAGVRYAELAPRLDAAGFALPNLGSLPHISVAGACATGTHGSGAGNGVLASAVRAVELVRADGSLMIVDDPGDLSWAVVNLGALGVVTALRLAVVPRYDVQQWVLRHLSRPALVEHIDAIMAAAYSVSVFTDWGDDSEIWLKQRAGDRVPPPGWLGTRPASGQRGTGPGVDPAHGTPQLGVAGPWHQRLPHFRAEFTPSWGEELQTEFFVPREHASAALEALIALRERIVPLLAISEIRAVAADELWLSGAYGRDTVALHFTWKPDEAAVRALLPDVEAALAPFDARPHWAKVFTAEPGHVVSRYPRMADFARRRAELDPDDVFANAYLDSYLPA